MDQSEVWKSVLQPIKRLPSAAVQLYVKMRTSFDTGLLEQQLESWDWFQATKGWVAARQVAGGQLGQVAAWTELC